MSLVRNGSARSRNPAKKTESFALRLGMRYVKGLREEIAAEIVRERAVAAIYFD